MAETQQLTELQRATMVARFVEIQDISMTAVNAELLASRDVIMSAGEWHIAQEKKVVHHFDEAKKLLSIDLKLTAIIGDSENRQFVRCSGSYALIYSFNVTGGPPPEERDAFFSAFANINAIFNAWSFFRELVHSTLGRMGLHPIALPVYRIAQPEQQPPAPKAPKG